MSEKCQFCGAENEADDPFYGVFFKCSTRTDYSVRGAECLVGIARRYESLFPVSAMDDSPITRDVCRKLGMQEVPPGCWRKSWAVVFFQLGEEQAYLVQILDVDFREVTAGQLALLVANPPMR